MYCATSTQICAFILIFTYTTVLADEKDRAITEVQLKFNEDGNHANVTTTTQSTARFDCLQNEYGPSCSYCFPEDTCIKGHYTCDFNTGNKICLPGWHGENCVNQLKPVTNKFHVTCPENVCRNGGTCVSGRCCCVPGFTGILCEIEIMECTNHSCLNGGTCKDLIGKYECLCKAHYTGVYCENKIQVLSARTTPSRDSNCLADMCLNNGTCYEDSYFKYCVCPTGFSGDRCENGINMTPPAINNCKRDHYGPNCNTVCIPEDSCAGDHYICNPSTGSKVCLSGWIGNKCNTRLLPQNLDTYCPANMGCKNDGQCYKGGCCCKNNYSGDFCNVESIGCLSGPCANNGTCNTVGNGFVCICPGNYSGQRCETHILYPTPKAPTVRPNSSEKHTLFHTFTSQLFQPNLLSSTPFLGQFSNGLSVFISTLTHLDSISTKQSHVISSTSVYSNTDHILHYLDFDPSLTSSSLPSMNSVSISKFEFTTALLQSQKSIHSTVTDVSHVSNTLVSSSSDFKLTDLLQTTKSSTKGVRSTTYIITTLSPTKTEIGNESPIHVQSTLHMTSLQASISTRSPSDNQISPSMKPSLYSNEVTYASSESSTFSSDSSPLVSLYDSSSTPLIHSSSNPFVDTSTLSSTISSISDQYVMSESIFSFTTNPLPESYIKHSLSTIESPSIITTDENVLLSKDPTKSLYQTISATSSPVSPTLMSSRSATPSKIMPSFASSKQMNNSVTSWSSSAQQSQTAPMASTTHHTMVLSTRSDSDISPSVQNEHSTILYEDTGAISSRNDLDLLDWWWILVIVVAILVLMLTLFTGVCCIIRQRRRDSREIKTSPETILAFDKEHFSVQPDFSNPSYDVDNDSDDDSVKTDIYIVNQE